jgi:hypothetical protein
MLERQHHVLDRAQIGKQLKTLEHEAQALGAHRRARVFVELEKVMTGQTYRAGGRHIEAGDDRQQRALARTRGADDGNRLLARERKRNVVENRQRAGRIADLFGDVIDFDQRWRRTHERCCCGCSRRRTAVAPPLARAL